MIEHGSDVPRLVSAHPARSQSGADQGHDSVVLSRPLPEHGLQIGDIGAVVFVHRNNEAYEVEFIAGDGNTAGVVTLKPEDIRRLDAAKFSMPSASRHNVRCDRRIAKLKP
jgi:hypothetical protein